jgi:phage shock protein C
MARRFYRSSTDKQIAGVCGAIGAYFDIDSNLVRLLFVVASIVTVAFPGGLIYILSWIFFPEGPTPYVDDPK